MTIDILIVDDGEEMNSLVTRFNTEFGYNATVCDVAGARKYIAEQKPIIAIVEPHDETQPPFKANDRTELIKEMAENGIPVVLGTCVDKSNLSRYGINPDDYQYYQKKPYSAENIAAVIKSVRS